MKRLIVGITGASASIYGVRLLEVLTKDEDIEVHLTISSSGARALLEELQIEVDLNNFELEHIWCPSSVFLHRELSTIMNRIGHRCVNCQRLFPH